jgi:lactate racemase
MSMIGTGSQYQFLPEEQVDSVITQGLGSLNLGGKRVIVIIPDSTRTMPMPMFFRLITRQLMGKVSRLDFLIALGTHPAMSESAILRLVGITAHEKATCYAEVNIYNHAWKDPAALTMLGTIPCSEVRGLSGGLLEMDVPVRLNCRIMDYDEILICGLASRAAINTSSQASQEAISSTLHTGLVR